MNLFILFFFLYQGLELKGQMVHCPESDSILFVSSPFLNGLEGLTGRGLFISDIPLHDATRDVILVGEQARAQVRSKLILSLTLPAWYSFQFGSLTQIDFLLFLFSSIFFIRSHWVLFECLSSTRLYSLSPRIAFPTAYRWLRITLDFLL